MKKTFKKTSPSFSEEQGKHQKAKKEHLNKKQQKGNKGNVRWENFNNDF